MILGICGGILGVAIIGAVIFFLMRKPKNADMDIEDAADDECASLAENEDNYSTFEDEDIEDEDSANKV
jgi:hypothetical protein